MKEHLKNEPPYFVRRARWGFGFEVCANTDLKKRYTTPDEKQAKKVLDMLNAGKSLEELPAPSDKWEYRLVIFKEKHGNSYFLVKTLEEFGKIALKIFTQRRKQKWYYDFSEVQEKREEPLSEEQINALPTEKLKKVARESNANILSNATYYRDLERQKKMYDIIVEKKDPDVALRFLDSRRTWEYESFDVERFHNEDY